jgi:hypothetical protein
MLSQYNNSMRSFLFTLVIGLSSLSFSQNSFLPKDKLEMNYSFQSREGLSITWNSVHPLGADIWEAPSQYRFRSDYGFGFGGGRLSMFFEDSGSNYSWNDRQNFGFTYGFGSANTKLEIQFFRRERSGAFSRENGTDIKINFSTKF